MRCCRRWPAAQLGEASMALGPGEALVLQGRALLSEARPPSLCPSDNLLFSGTCAPGSPTDYGRAAGSVQGWGWPCAHHLHGSARLSAVSLHPGAHPAPSSALGASPDPCQAAPLGPLVTLCWAGPCTNLASLFPIMCQFSDSSKFSIHQSVFNLCSSQWFC